MDFNEAVDALVAANTEGNAAAEQAPASTQGSEGAAGQETQDSLFESVNPDELPEELQRLAKQLQADYTRKTQELAEKRKVLETLGDIDPEFARDAAAVVMALSSDPEYQFQVYKQLENVLSQSGRITVDDGDVDDDLYGDLDDDLGDNTRLQRLEQRLQAFEQRAAVLEHTHLIQRQEAAIREMHPEYDQEDLNRIYSLAYAHGGDLFKADQAYQQWIQGIVGKYLKQKTDVPDGVKHVPASGPAVRPTNIDSIEAGHEAAKEYLKNILGG